MFGLDSRNSGEHKVQLGLIESTLVVSCTRIYSELVCARYRKRICGTVSFIESEEACIPTAEAQTEASVDGIFSELRG